MTEDRATGIVDASGKPARKGQTDRCPQCGAGPEKRIASGGFGAPHPICGGCSAAGYGQAYEWKDEAWRG